MVHHRGVTVVDVDGVLERLGQQDTEKTPRPESARDYEEGIIAPQLSVMRYAMHDPVVKEDIALHTEWEDFITDFGRENARFGRTRSIGNLVVSYLDADDFRTMLSRDETFSQKPARRKKQYMRKLCQEYNRTVGDFADAEIRTNELMRRENDDLQDQDRKQLKTMGLGWTATHFHLQDVLRPVSRTRLAFMFSRDSAQQLHHELRETLRFFEKRGFHLPEAKTKEPHITILDAHFPLDKIEFRDPKKVDYPKKISLLPPEMSFEDFQPRL